MNRRTRKKKINIDLIVQIALLIALVPVLYELFVIEEVIRQWINKPATITYTNIGYYKCGGTKNNPKFCPIILKEKYNEND
jgi:hypothetical protein